MFWDTKVPGSNRDCMALRICTQERKSTQKIQIMEVSGHFPSKCQRHLQAPGCAVGVMRAGRSVEMGEQDNWTPSRSQGNLEF